jgi:hypothetical protein
MVLSKLWQQQIRLCNTLFRYLLLKIELKKSKTSNPKTVFSCRIYSLDYPNLLFFKVCPFIYKWKVRTVKIKYLDQFMLFIVQLLTIFSLVNIFLVH